MQLNNLDNNSQVAQKPVKPKKRWKNFFFLAILILVAIPVYLFYRFTQKPANGVIRTVSSNAEAIKTVEDVPETFAGKYLTFMYSNKYVLKSHDDQADASGIILERAFLSQTSALSQKIGLTIRSFPSHNLEDVPDYKMRELRTEKYKKETFSQGSVSGVDFIPADDGPFEKDFFIQKGDFLAIISVSAPAMPDETLNKEADLIAKSVAWLK